jgi:hypothetical protein
MLALKEATKTNEEFAKALSVGELKNVKPIMLCALHWYLA